jgi:hypothetical protein
LAAPLDYQTPNRKLSTWGLEKLAYTITLVHFALTVITLVVGFPLAMSDFDRPGAPGAPIGDALMFAARILMLPLGLIPVPGFGGWVVMFTNSAIWGFGIAYLVRLIRGNGRKA